MRIGDERKELVSEGSLIDFYSKEARHP
jgi:hypothetical protein